MMTRTRELATQVSRSAYFAEATTGLAAIALESGDLNEALAYVHTATAYTAQHGFEGFDARNTPLV